MEKKKKRGNIKADIQREKTKQGESTKKTENKREKKERK